MSIQLPGISGKTCVKVIKIRHHYQGQVESPRGPVQFNWSDGSVTTMDSKSDLTVVVTDQPWIDPYAEVTGDARDRLEEEVGLWMPTPVDREDPLHAVVGRVASAIEAISDSAGLLIGAIVRFGDVQVSARIADLDDWDLDVTVERAGGTERL
ncbi:hypothetical protein [Microlunatus speluncae]|uniref:hypothetical protein n=1 Tax=Microlunatus speluncae TaxID=2594267 RepID=UPI0012660CF5|nr:hypothetical protein [Microlunatus speluncae]